jgi:hypothetical protein
MDKALPDEIGQGQRKMAPELGAIFLGDQEAVLPWPTRRRLSSGRQRHRVVRGRRHPARHRVDRR